MAAWILPVIGLALVGFMALVPWLSPKGFQVDVHGRAFGVLVVALKRLRESEGSLDLVVTSPRVLKVLALTGLDIVIPVYNEGGNILATLRALARDVKTPARVLIFGAGAIDASLAGLPARPHLLLLGGVLAASLPLAPLAAACGVVTTTTSARGSSWRFSPLARSSSQTSVRLADR